MLVQLLVSVVSTAQNLRRLQHEFYPSVLFDGIPEDIAVDSLGFVWVSTSTGLFRYNGNEFKPVLAGRDLHHPVTTDNIALCSGSNGRMYMGTREALMRYNAGTNVFEQIVSGKNALMVPMLEKNDRLYVRKGLSLLEFNSQTGKVLSKNAMPPEQNGEWRFLLGTAAMNGPWLVFQAGAHVGLCNADTKQFSAIKSFLPSNIISFDQGFVFYDNNGLYHFNKDNSLHWLLKLPFLHTEPRCDYKSLVGVNDSVVVLGYNRRLFEVDLRNKVIKAELVDASGNPFFENGYIKQLAIDSSGHIWVITNTNGVMKLNYQSMPIRYFGTGNRIENFIKCILVDKKANLVIAGTYEHGIRIFDTTQHLLGSLLNTSKANIRATVTTIAPLSERQYLVGIFDKPNLFVLDARKGFSLRPLQIQPDTFSFRYYYSQVIQKQANAYYALTGMGPVALKLDSSGKKLQVADSKSSKLGAISIAKDCMGNLWCGRTDTLAVLDSQVHLKFYVPLGANTVVKCIAEDVHHHMWLATNKGLLQVSEMGKLLRKFTIADGLADNNLYAVAADRQGRIWISHNRGIDGLLPETGSIIHLSRNDGLQEDEFNANCVYTTSDGELYWGGIDGVSSFYPGQLVPERIPVKVFVDNLKVNDEPWQNDTATWNIRSMALGSTENTISFDILALGIKNTGQYNFQCRLLGFDKQWVNGGSNNHVRYVLPPGTYTLQLYAGQSFSKQATPLYTIAITVAAPLWQQGWFIALGILVLLSGVGIVFRAIGKKKMKKRELELQQQLLIQDRLQSERERISRDLHDNIGAYTTALIAGLDELPLKNGDEQQVSELKDYAQNIMLFLRETIWVLSNKSFSVTAFSDRFKSFARKVAKGFPAVQLLFEDEISMDRLLHPNEAINLFRLMQEALQNALKHAHPSTITVSIRSDEFIEIGIADNGCGFENNNSAGGNGLSNMEFRAAEAGYQLSIESGKGRGTVILLHQKHKTDEHLAHEELHS